MTRDKQVAILLVPVSEVEQAWPVALPLLRKANTVGEELNEEEALADLKNGTRQLWLGEQQSFACLTELRQSKFRKYVIVYMLGGKSFRDWYVDLTLYIYAWGRVQGATTMEIHYPRPGWERVLARLGFIKFDEDTLVKEIA